MFRRDDAFGMAAGSNAWRPQQKPTARDACAYIDLLMFQCLTYRSCKRSIRRCERSLRCSISPIWFSRAPFFLPGGQRRPNLPALEHGMSGQGPRRSSTVSARLVRGGTAPEAPSPHSWLRRSARARPRAFPRTRMRSSLTLPQSPGARSTPSARPSSHAGTHSERNASSPPRQPLPHVNVLSRPDRPRLRPRRAQPSPRPRLSTGRRDSPRRAPRLLLERPKLTASMPCHDGPAR
jgi:hypothetical protein